MDYIILNPCPKVEDNTVEDDSYHCHEHAIVANCCRKLCSKFPQMHSTFGKFNISNGLFWCHKAVTHLLWLDKVKGTAISSSIQGHRLYNQWKTE